MRLLARDLDTTGLLSTCSETVGNREILQRAAPPSHAIRLVLTDLLHALCDRVEQSLLRKIFRLVVRAGFLCICHGLVPFMNLSTPSIDLADDIDRGITPCPDLDDRPEAFSCSRCVHT